MQLYGKYLGFHVGPMADAKNWIDAADKFDKRVKAWADHLNGLHCSALTYNTFALPTLTYLA